MASQTVLMIVLVVAAATWFGGSIACTAIGARIAAADDPGALGRFAKEYVQLAPGLFGGTGFLSLAAAIWLVAISGDLTFTTPWVLVSLVLWFVSLVLAATAVGFSWTRIAVALGHAVGNHEEARTPSTGSANAPGLVRRALRLSWLDVLIRVVVAVLVVWQPG